MVLCITLPLLQLADIAFLGRFQLQDWTINIPEFYRNVIQIVQSRGEDTRSCLGQLLQVDLSVDLANPNYGLDGYPWDIFSEEIDRIGYRELMESFKKHRMVCLNTYISYPLQLIALADCT